MTEEDVELMLSGYEVTEKKVFENGDQFFEGLFSNVYVYNEQAKELKEKYIDQEISIYKEITHRDKTEGYGIIIGKKENKMMNIFINKNSFYEMKDRPYYVRFFENGKDVKGIQIEKEVFFKDINKIIGLEEAYEKMKEIIFLENNCKLINVLRNNL